MYLVFMKKVFEKMSCINYLFVAPFKHCYIHTVECTHFRKCLFSGCFGMQTFSDMGAMCIYSVDITPMLSR